MTYCAEPVSPVVTYHGEGPFWDFRTGRLMCVDVLAGELVAIGPVGDVSRYAVPDVVASVVRRRSSGGFVIATEHGLVVADDELSTFERLVEFTDDPNLRTNDGGCDPLGGFVVGTMAYNEQPGCGSVYRVTPDRQVVELLSPVSISNGVQWSADGRRVFYVDTPTRRIDVFDVDPVSGTWSGRRPHVHIDGAAGFPDGMAIDEEDGLWVALWGGGVVHHYDGTGCLVDTIEVPGVTQPSSCAFGGDQWNVLYITTSRQGVLDGQQPYAGAVFAVQTESRGATTWEFDG